MQLNDLQASLEGVYDVATPHRVEDFLLRDPALAARLAGEAPEQLLVMQSEETVDVGLYLHQDVLRCLADDSPADALHEGNLEAFWLALEGVSHFLYLVWNAGHERPITQLELELQAEVDKFVLTAALLCQQRGELVPGALWEGLFQRIGFRPDLDANRLARYREANRMAARYCRDLTRRFRLRPGEPDLSRELRRFYRMPQGAKLRRIGHG
jgi:hypothetical protein